MFYFKVITFISFSVFLFNLNPISQPSQKNEGCGGKSYTHNKVKFEEYGNYKNGYFLFEPESPRPDSAPVVVFLHGYSAYNPMVFGKWIKHLVLKGNIVIFPKYQKNLSVPKTDKFDDYAIVGIENAYKELHSGNHVKPDNSPLCMVGHSFGGAIIAKLLNDQGDYEFPKPETAFLVSPGTGPFKKFEYDDYSKISSDVQLLVMVSQGDLTVGDRFGKKVFETAVNTPKRNLIRQFEDDHGKPKIRHGHTESYARDKEFDSGRHGYSYQRAKRSHLDPTDYNGYWKLLDALMDCSRNGENCNIAFGNSSEQRSLGNWSDGTPIKELEITLPPNWEPWF